MKAIVLTGAGDKALLRFGADLAKNAKGFAFAVDRAARALHRGSVQAPAGMHAAGDRASTATSWLAAGILCACDMAIAADDIRIGTTESRSASRR
ncbi:MAG: hypothetical protein IPO11_15535 [Betaproteobacteria bacterium]|nr:hypothetical protein [Betaproteobacteria bacterium]